MFKIWARVIKDEKIKKQYMCTYTCEFNKNNLYDYLVSICKELDIETPIVLSNHINNFDEFSSVKFLSSDFIDKINFNYLILEQIKE
ncbi:MAG: hypothetical protein PHC46_00685 [Clostridia bacterium]|nr:hypothetical protein [Clostridia bacterium]